MDINANQSTGVSESTVLTNEMTAVAYEVSRRYLKVLLTSEGKDEIVRRTGTTQVLPETI